MKVKQIFELCVKEGINADPRGEKKIKQMLEKRKKAFEKMEKEDKGYFDKETLWNPYDDSRILYDTEKEVKTALIGIDMEEGEILLANELNKQGKKIDVIWAHHPEGRALMGLDEVMHLQIDTLTMAGVPVNQAEAIMRERIKEVGENLSALNAERIEQATKLLGIPYFNTHTPADNHVQEYLTRLLEKKKPETLGEIIKALKEVPEYKEGMKQKIGPLIFVGSEESLCGKIYVDVTGGTESHQDAYKKLAEKGIGTVVAMHVGKEMKKEAEKNHMNIVIAGHIPSDNLGMNLLLDKVEKKAKLNLIECSGFKRIKRK
ncbi:MAG: NGG1p interacting factor NIF3 [Candidatus Diapherotrites archaeon]|nr:NGG1p interacting factor NIF3 [Candidatus Diapherotrites archaeon]